jgi:hypothetical protein
MSVIPAIFKRESRKKIRIEIVKNYYVYISVILREKQLKKWK